MQTLLTITQLIGAGICVAVGFIMGLAVYARMSSQSEVAEELRRELSAQLIRIGNLLSRLTRHCEVLANQPTADATGEGK